MLFLALFQFRGVLVYRQLDPASMQLLRPEQKGKISPKSQRNKTNIAAAIVSI